MVRVPKHGAEDYAAYWVALGKFIHCFSSLEIEIKMALAYAVGVRPGITQAIWSGTRADAALQLLRRVRQMDDAPQDVSFERWSSQFTIINTARNEIVHSPAEFNGKELIVTNFAKALPSACKEILVSEKLLDNMTADVCTISVGVICYLYRTSQKEEPPVHWIEAANAPWLHIFQQQTQKNHTRTEKDRRQPLPPKP